ncbi:major facilitator superfamily domain-containing protein [Trichoderma breve]|uniref:Major facilitator superfamily domain-containing protein n=1 Tax=Trichoderma breve TaxID=2034170 RepID=A0A9W9E7Y6_9HYPO|nr:major facilitator superfamily domain-containing protein [Trichoderma breve]KAJ4859867.1 major facilitator superfamily domain-containing protein [Trichoderma breve]
MISIPQSHFDWDQDTRNPFNWTQRRKWTTIAVACWVTFITGLNATSITTAAEVVSRQFHLPDNRIEVNFFAVVAWNAAAAFVPLVTLPLMDTYGTRIGYLACYVLFTIFVIPQALAQNFATLVVSRVFAGAFGGTVQNAADGIIANVFRHHHERALPLTIYILALLMGVTMGPVLGAVFEPLNWRWIFWVQLIICGATLPLVAFCAEETRGSVIQAQILSKTGSAAPAKLSEDENPIRMLKETITRSAKLLVAEPTITSFTIWTSFAFGLVFISTQSVPLVFARAYSWGSYSSGLAQSAIAIGEIIGFAACLYQNHIYHDPVPESILYLSIPSTAIALSGGLFMYGWSIFQAHWVVTALALLLIGYASMVIVTAVTIYITHSYAGFAASAIAAVAFGENLFAAFLPLATKAMYEDLGYQWASSLLGFVALTLTLAPIILLWKGRAIRGRGKMVQSLPR